MNAFGIDEIGVWSHRRVTRDRWLGGSTATYVFEISERTAGRLRERCMPNETVPPEVFMRTCTFALRARQEQTMWADVTPNTVVLHYVFN
jgi:hypothetical protein